MASTVIAITTTVKILPLSLSFIVPPPRDVSCDVDDVVPSQIGTPSITLREGRS
jgi:hypothetical protein